MCAQSAYAWKLKAHVWQRQQQRNENRKTSRSTNERMNGKINENYTKCICFSFFLIVDGMASSDLRGKIGFHSHSIMPHENYTNYFLFCAFVFRGSYWRRAVYQSRVRGRWASSVGVNAAANSTTKNLMHNIQSNSSGNDFFVVFFHFFNFGWIFYRARLRNASEMYFLEPQASECVTIFRQTAMCKQTGDTLTTT